MLCVDSRDAVLEMASSAKSRSVSSTRSQALSARRRLRQLESAIARVNKIPNTTIMLVSLIW